MLSNTGDSKAIEIWHFSVTSLAAHGVSEDERLIEGLVGQLNTAVAADSRRAPKSDAIGMRLTSYLILLQYRQQ